jgi:hypothetical protein
VPEFDSEWAEDIYDRDYEPVDDDGDDELREAASRLLDNVSPHISALEVDHGADGEELYGDLAEALGLPRDYGSDSWRERTAGQPDASA